MAEPSLAEAVRRRGASRGDPGAGEFDKMTLATSSKYGISLGELSSFIAPP